jgi:fructose/tagatose bisphosphate aldolase
MPLVPFDVLMADAEAGGYAVGYFESWNLESLMAVADAAEAMRSPVILGFSGIYLADSRRIVKEPLSVYAAMGLEICRKLSAPACLLFNESPRLDSVLKAVDEGFNLVMFSDEGMELSALRGHVQTVCAKAHDAGAAVEAEMASLQGMGEQVTEQPADLRLTDPDQARRFVEETGVDALAINIGQVHLHGRDTVSLDLDRLTRLKRAVGVPLSLHGATSVDRAHLVEAIRRGISKINVGSILKQTYFNEMRAACLRSNPGANPYEVIGSGLPEDVLVAGRVALQKAVEDYMQLFGSAGRARRIVP